MEYRLTTLVFRQGSEQQQSRSRPHPVSHQAQSTTRHFHPKVMAAFRNTAIGLMHWAGETNITAACRRIAAQPWSALAVIGIIAEN